MELERRIAQTNQGNHFMLHNGIRLTEMREDYAAVELEVMPESKNLYGAVHGGVFLTMADCAAGGAARSRGMRYVTLSSSVQFFRNTEHPRIIATASIRHRGKTICVATVDVKDGDGRLLAGGTMTLFATGKLDE